MITCGRLSYTMRAVRAIKECEDIKLYIIDNGSVDNTVNWLRTCGERVLYNRENMGIAYAFNQFLEHTNGLPIVGKIDNDTLIQPDFIKKMKQHLQYVDLVQARHKLIAASAVGTFDQWTSKMKKITPTLVENHFIGGSGILINRNKVDFIPETENKLLGWREWQRQHPEVRKGFALDCEVKLLDEDGYPEEYHDYYKQTGRI